MADDGVGQDDPFQMEKQRREREVAAGEQETGVELIFQVME